MSVEVKKSQHRYVIGPKGSGLTEILSATGVSVEIPPSDNVSETITLRGDPDKLGPALTMVYAKVCYRHSMHGSPVTMTCRKLLSELVDNACIPLFQQTRNKCFVIVSVFVQIRSAILSNPLFNS